MTVVKKISKSEFGKSVQLAKLNPANKVSKPSTSKYVMLGGIPHKMVNGSFVQLTKLVK